jgi:hypothetical protein
MSICKTLGLTYAFLAATFFTIEFVCRTAKSLNNLRHSPSRVPVTARHARSGEISEIY